ncbi:hypothetical protein [Streptomyces longisporoflavus]|uniref:Uncharacterized protein n=1 Tax=Streptomyces longisporoflavus TaxID=28044 RepID=A0ABW7QIP2_9ACTN
MTYDPLDVMFRRIDLTQAMEDQFGTSRVWPLHLRAAHAQLEQLRRLIGDAHYETFTDCALEAVRRREAGQGQGELHSHYLGRELHQQGLALGEGAAQVAWGIACGLTVLLDDDQYEKVITAAAVGCRTSTAGTCPAPGATGASLN